MPKRSRSAYLRYGSAVVGTVLATVARLALDSALGMRQPYVTFYIAVVATAWYGGFGPSVLALVLGALVATFFFIAPEGALAGPDAVDSLGLVLYFFVGIAVILFNELQRAARRQLEREIGERERSEAAERAHRERLRVTLTSIGDAVVTTDAEGRVTLLNTAAEELTGWRTEEAAGRPVEEVVRIVHEGTGEVVESPVARVLRDGVIVGQAGQTALVARDGTARPIDDSAAPIKDQAGQITGAVLIVRDITERKRTERRRSVRLEVTQILAEAATIADGAPRLVHALGYGLRWDIAEFWSVDERSTRLRRLCSWHRFSVGAAEFEAASGDDTYAPGIGLPGRVWRSGQSTWIPDVAHDSNCLRAPLALKEGLHAAFGCPVRFGDEVIGVLTFFSSAIQPPDDDLLEMMATIGGQIGQFMERKRTEAELRESEERHRSISELTTDFTYVARIEPDGNLELESVGDGFTQVTGYTLDELKARGGWAAVVPVEDLPLALRAVEQMRAGETVIEVRRLRTKGGEIRWINHLGRPLQDDARGLVIRILGAGQDITARKWVEEALHESEQRFRQLAENITAVFWMVDPHLPKVLYVSPAFEAIYGRPCRLLLDQPRSLLEAVDPDDRERVRASQERQARGETTAEEYRIVRPDGSMRWIWDRGFPIKDATGQVIRVAGIAEDITERKRTEEALRESEQRFRQLADAMPQIVWTSRPDGYLDYYNRRWYEFTGFPRGGGDESWVPILHPDDASTCLDVWYGSVRSGEPYQIEYRFWDRRTGQYRWHLGRALPVRDEAGRIIKWFGTSTDIDDQKRAEEALRESDRHKNEFLAMLAHELRNPLAPIRTALHLMRQPGGDGNGSYFEGEREMVERQVRHLTRLVDDLLDISRISRGKIELRKEVVDLAAVVDRAVETIRPLLVEHDLHLTVSLPSEPARLEADPTRLEQVLANLLHNAAKYTDSGGRIDLIAAREGDEVVLRVRDTGIGITPEMLPRIFEMFVQAERRLDRSQGGLGIGLSLVRTLVEIHGGRVTAHSAGLGQGSEFVVRLPALAWPAQGARAAPPRSQRPADALPPRHRILIVDDNPDAANSLARLLTRLWHQDVQVAHDGPAALAAAQAFRPDVILLDIGMPGMDGYEVAQRLRRQPEFATTLLVALTGWGQEEDRRRSQDAGIDHHLVKPADPEILREMLAGQAIPAG
jgi:PAS domain S-box-containing protein